MGVNTMLAAQRVEKIKKIMVKYKKIDVATLSDTLQVSDVTVRKDLEKLEEQGFLKKIHGGAILKETESGLTGLGLNIDHLEEKEIIAEMAFKTIKKGDSIFLGSGSTCYILSKLLKKLNDITVVTNNINALIELAPNVKNVFLLGGEIAYHEGVILSSGRKTGNYLDDIRVNRAFTSISCLDIEAGLTVNRSVSSYLYDTVKKVSKEWTLLVDHNKYDRIGLYKVASICEVDCIICDAISTRYKESFLKEGIKFLTP